MSRPTAFCFLAALLLGGALSASAQRSHTQFLRLGLEEGLSQATAMAVLQDRSGYLWIATEDGLNRYDGYGFSVLKHDPGDPHSLSDNYVVALLEDADGGIWAGTSDGGLNRYDPRTGRFTRYRHDTGDPASLSHDRITALALAADGGVWAGTYGGGLSRYDPRTGRFTRYQHAPDDPASLPSDYLWAVLVDRQGRLWAGTRNGLARLDGGAFTVYRPDPSDAAALPGGDVVALFEDTQGTLWVGTDNGLGSLAPQADAFTVYRHDPGDPATLSRNAVSSVRRDRRGSVWVGTYGGGLNRLDPASGRFTRYRHDPTDATGLPDDYVSTVYESPDASGLLWVGTFSGGLARFNPAQDRFRLYRHDPADPASLIADYVRTFAETPDGALWVGTRDGLSRQDPRTGRFTHFMATGRPGGLSASYVRALLTDREGTLWVGTAAGLNRYDTMGGTFDAFPHAPFSSSDPEANRVYVLLEARDGLVWVGTRKGLHAFDPRAGAYVRPAGVGGGRGVEGEVIALAETADGALWAGTTGLGLFRVDPASGHVTPYRHDPNDAKTLSNDRILGILPAADGTLWVSTHSGLNRFDPASGRARRFTEADGLPAGLVYGALEDGDGRLWLPTNRGLARFDPATGRVRTYDASDGLQSNEFNQGAYYKARNGDLVVGGIRGFNRFAPAAITDNPHVPPIVLTRFRIFGDEVAQPLAEGGVIRLTYRDAYFAFEFAALDFANPARNQYAYKLEGFDQGWHHAGTRRYVSYTNLNGGRYVFRVRGSNNDGVWNEEGLAIPVVIVPPYWATWWFRGGLALLVLGLGFAGAWGWQRGRLRLLEENRDEIAEAKRRLAVAREQERLHLARELHDGPVQDLYSANLQLAFAAEAMGGEEELGGVREVIRRVNGSLRTICGDLRPPALGPFGLAAALRSHVERLRAAHPSPPIEVSLMADGQRLPEPLRLALFRIAQEALSNAVRHSGARGVRIAFHFDAEEAVLEVCDDGVGFQVPERLLEGARVGRYGLLGMAERAEALGGRLTITSAEGGGTSIRVTVPIPEREPLAGGDGALPPVETPSLAPPGDGV